MENKAQAYQGYTNTTTRYLAYHTNFARTLLTCAEEHVGVNKESEKLQPTSIDLAYTTQST